MHKAAGRSDAGGAAVRDSGAGRSIHLAGLQVPFCKADPVLGARVNVVGTLNLFQAASESAIARLVYASSAATYGDGSRGDDDQIDLSCFEPMNLYGQSKHRFDLWALRQTEAPPRWAGVK